MYLTLKLYLFTMHISDILDDNIDYKAIITISNYSVIRTLCLIYVYYDKMLKEFVNKKIDI